MWLPWARRKRESAAEVRRARAALDASTRDAPRADRLAEELERIVRENHLSPRIRAAFRAHPGGGPH